MPVPLALAILRQVCDSLARAHDLRDPMGQPLWLVHGDVSPTYIFVDETGVVKLMARNIPYGTPGYMAPELITAGQLDLRADLFALGVVAHEMFANRPLFTTGDYQETIQRVCMLPIPPPSTLNPEVPPEIDGIVLTALSRDPTMRWPSALMMRDGLAAVEHRLGLHVTQLEPWHDLLAGRLANAPSAAPMPAPVASTPQPTPMPTDAGRPSTRPF